MKDIQILNRGVTMKPNPECPVCKGGGYPPNSKYPCRCWR